MKRALRSVLLLTAACCHVWPAQAAKPAGDLDELLSQVRRAQSEEMRTHDRREQRFASQRRDQQWRLEQVEAALAAERQRNDALQQKFDSNEQRQAELGLRLRERAGSLTELGGIFRQVWGDTRAMLQDSLISTQLTGRQQEMESQALRQEIPSISQLEALWYALQQEMTESGKVASYHAEVTHPDGASRRLQVVRVGPFNAVAKDGLLRYRQATGKLEALARQPASGHRSTPEGLPQADGNLYPMAIDPSRGAVIDLLTQVPNLGERIMQGRLVGYIIIGITALALLIVIERFFYLSLTGWRIKRQLSNPTPDRANPLGRVMKVYQDNVAADTETLELKLDEAIIKNSRGLQRGLSTIRILAVIAPMLGLLGTVTGLIETFQSITLFGTGDPRLMAGGISQALITTALGLTSAIPLILLHTMLQGKSRRLLGILDEQSVGIMAMHAEGEKSYVAAA